MSRRQLIFFSRWGLQHDMVTLPKSVRRERLLENANVHEIEISKEDMAILDGLDEHLVTDWYVLSIIRSKRLLSNTLCRDPTETP